MDRIKVSVINRSHNELPVYGTSGAAGMDVRASLPGEAGGVASNAAGAYTYRLVYAVAAWI